MAESQYGSEFWAFVNKHKSENVEKLRLKYHPQSGTVIDLALIHIQCLQKSGKKFIDERGKNHAPKLLQSPLSIEQASSASIAMFHSSLVKQGSKILDMTCGLGVDTLAFSNIPGSQITTCELNPLYAQAAEYNFSEIENIRVIKGDSVEFLKTSEEKFDVIFIDPARRDSNGGRVYNIHDCTPDVAEIKPLMLQHTSKIIVKLSPMLDLTQTIRDLCPSEIYSVQGENGECKELLAVIEKGTEVPEVQIGIRYNSQTLTFTQSEEQKAVAAYGVPSVGDYLYEPNAATMKAGPYSLLCERLGLTKLHPNTHLYYSETSIKDFPGKVYKIIDVMSFSSSEIKTFSKKYPKVNVATRNFILSPEELIKKLKVKNGGNLKVFGVTRYDGAKILIITEMD